MKKNKAAFLDRDGVINIDYGYVHDSSKFEFCPGVFDYLRELQELGFLLVIISNQSGVGRGFFSEEDLKNLDLWMKIELSKQNIMISGSYYCPHYEKSLNPIYSIICDCRKPKTGLFYKAASDLDIDIDRSIAIGDKLRDCSISLTTDCKGFVIGNNETKEILKRITQGKYKNIIYCEGFKEVFNYLKDH